MPGQNITKTKIFEKMLPGPFGRRFANSVSIWEVLILIYLCGKAYYFGGFVDHLKPTAPNFIIFLKDFVAVILIVFNFRLLRSAPLKTVQIIYFLLVAFALVVIGTHGQVKSIEIIGQHYIRNVFLTILFFQVALVLFSNVRSFNIQRVILTFSLLNILGAIIQIFYFPQALFSGVRPLGLVGDPISVSIIIWSVIPFAIFYFSHLGLLFFAIAAGYVLNACASISALVAGLTSIALLSLYLAIYFRKTQWVREFARKLTIFFVVAGFGLLIKTPDTEFNLYGRLGILQDAALKKILGESVQGELHESPFHIVDRYKWLTEGRKKSAMVAFDLCSSGDSYFRCALGDISSPQYYKLDSNFSSLAMNWGLVCAIFFYGFNIFIIYKCFFVLIPKIRSEEGQVTMILIGSVCLVFLISGIFVTFIYRFPLNVILYFCLAKIVHEKTTQMSEKI